MERFTQASTESSLEQSELRELSPKERRVLRDTLKALGIVLATITPLKMYQTYSDYKSSYETPMSSEEGVSATTTTVNEVEREVIDENPSPHFERVRAARLLRLQLHANEVMATTTRGELIAGPIELHAHSGWEVEDMISPTPANQGVIQGIPGTYLRQMRADIADQYDIPAESIVIEHVYRNLQLSHTEGQTIQERALSRLAQVPEGETTTYRELINNYFSPQFGESESGHFLQESLRRILPALILKESMFNPQAVSSSGARAELQILPTTFQRFAGNDEDYQRFSTQLSVASRYFESSYRYLTTNLRNQLDIIRINYFDDDEMRFNEYFLFPLLINAYNAGDGNMERVVRWFVATYPELEDLQDGFGAPVASGGHDVFLAMATLAREQGAVPAYGQEASRYTLDIISTSTLLQPSQVASDEIRVASR
jgi:hypothetical protein